LGKFADLIEKERSSVSLLNQSSVVVKSSCEGSFAMAKKRAFIGAPGEASAVDSNPRLVGIKGEEMEKPCYSLLSRAAFPVEVERCPHCREQREANNPWNQRRLIVAIESRERKRRIFLLHDC